MSGRQCVLLLLPLARALPRGRLAAGALAAFGLAALLPAGPDAGGPAMSLQYAALALGIAVASVLDDPAASTIAAVPPALLTRRGMTFVVVAPALVAAWVVLVATSSASVELAGALTLQSVAIVLLALALAVVLARGSAVSGPLVALAFVGLHLFAPRWAVDPDVRDWRWDAIWVALAVASLLTLLVVSRDPGRRSAR